MPWGRLRVDKDVSSHTDRLTFYGVTFTTNDAENITDNEQALDVFSPSSYVRYL